MIKAVLFDIDGVLVDSFDANLQYFTNLLKRAGYKPPTREEYISIFPLTVWDSVKELTKSNSEKEINRIVEMAKTNVDYPYHLIKISEEVLDAVHKLEKYKLGIVTSRVKEGFYNNPVLVKLKEHFPLVVTYEDTKKHKPDAEPLLFACEKLNIKPEEAVYIGDQQVDIDAAKGAGMKIILYSKEKFGSPDLYTSTFVEIPELIGTLL